VSDLKKPKIVAIAAGVLAVVILAGGYLMLVSPKRTKAAELQTATQAAQTQLAVALAQSHRPAAGAADRVEIADLFRLERAMPDRVDIAGVLLDLSRAAHRAGTQLKSVTPGTPTAAASGYQSVPVVVEFEGRYSQLTSLLADLRGLVAVRKGDLQAGGRLFGVDSVQFAAAEAAFPQVKATLNLEAYVFAASTGAGTSTQTTTTDPAPASDDSVSAAGSGTAG
jgi:Tfp pilus assembly protein PilO